MDITLLREAVTVVSFLAFLAIIAWAIHPGNRQGFEQAARMPLEDDSPSPLGEGRGEGPRYTTPSPTLPQGGGSKRWRRFREIGASIDE